MDPNAVPPTQKDVESTKQVAEVDAPVVSVAPEVVAVEKKPEGAAAEKPSQPVEIELTSLNVVKQSEAVQISYCCAYSQTAELYSLTPNDLGAPTAENKGALFDWQMENDGPKSVDNFGGLEHIVKVLGSNIETVRFYSSRS